MTYKEAGENTACIRRRGQRGYWVPYHGFGMWGSSYPSAEILRKEAVPDETD